MWPEDLGLTLFDMRMNKVTSSHLSWIIPDTPEEAFRLIERSALDLLEQAGIDREELYGVSLSSSGIVDYDNLTLKYSVHTPNWGANVPVGDFLRDIFGSGPVLFEENAGKSISRAILSEQEDPNQSILVLFTSWGLSGALIQEGRILNGRNSLVGEIGHMILDQNDQELCSCGSRGCAERLVSVARVRKLIAGDPPPEDSPCPASRRRRWSCGISSPPPGRRTPTPGNTWPTWRTASRPFCGTCLWCSARRRWSLWETTP